MSDWPVVRDPWFGCDIWQGALDHGYPKTTDGRWAHRVAYERKYGPIAPGLTLDHACRRRACVRPEHLEAVTKAENVKRIQWRYRAGRKACRAGHDLKQHGRRTETAGFICRLCSGV